MNETAALTMLTGAVALMILAMAIMPRLAKKGRSQKEMSTVGEYLEALDQDLLIEAFELEPDAFQWLQDTVEEIRSSQASRLASSRP